MVGVPFFKTWAFPRALLLVILDIQFTAILERGEVAQVRDSVVRSFEGLPHFSGELKVLGTILVGLLQLLQSPDLLSGFLKFSIFIRKFQIHVVDCLS